MRGFFPACLLLGLLLVAGCTQYQPVSPDSPVQLALAPVINESDLAQISAPLARNVREQIAHSAGYRLVDADQAEAVLQLRVLSLARRALARDPEDTGRPLSYRETVRVLLEWESDMPPPWGIEPVTRVETEILLYAQPELVSAESSAIAHLTNELAGKILARLNWPPAVQ